MDKHIKEDPIVHLGMACDTVILHRRELEVHAKALESQLQQVVQVFLASIVQTQPLIINQHFLIVIVNSKFMLFVSIMALHIYTH